MKLSNVIKDHRARLGSMREKNDHNKSSSENERRDEPDLDPHFLLQKAWTRRRSMSLPSAKAWARSSPRL
jgi:hypothetical protein